MKKINELFKPVNLTKGSVWKVIAGFSVPILISYLFQQIYTIADAAICGKFLSENQVAGVNNTGTIVFLVLQFAFGCTAGFSVITSKHSGQKNIGAIRRSLATQIVLSFMIGVILTAVSILSINPLLKGIGLQASANPVQNEIYRSAYVYVYIIFAGCLAQIFYNLSASFLRSVGDSFAPLIFLIVSAVLNIALDLLFIAVFHTGVAGAAIATIISQAISAIGCFVYTFARYKEYRLTKADFRIEKIPVINHLKLGLPLAFQFSILCIGLIVMQAVIVKFDTSADGVVISAAAQNGFGAATKLNNFLMCPFNALGTAMLSYCGQNYGAGNTERVKKRRERRVADCFHRLYRLRGRRLASDHRRNVYENILFGRKNQRGGYPLRKRLSLLRLNFILSPRRIVCAPQFFTRHRKIAVSAGCGGGRTDSENRFMPAVARGAQPRTD